MKNSNKQTKDEESEKEPQNSLFDHLQVQREIDEQNFYADNHICNSFIKN